MNTDAARKDMHTVRRERPGGRLPCRGTARRPARRGHGSSRGRRTPTPVDGLVAHFLKKRRRRRQQWRWVRCGGSAAAHGFAERPARAARSRAF